MISSRLASVLLCLFATTRAAPAAVRPRASSTPISAITSAQWAALNQSVDGRLFAGYPLAKPCYALYDNQLNVPNAGQCSTVEADYTDEVYVASQYGGYMNTNWGFCQKTGQSCAVGFDVPIDTSAVCYQGSVPNYYIEVQEVSDVQAALNFTNSTGVPLVIKNSGHDYKGRSSAPNALALWTHNVQSALTLEENFTPDGCTEPSGKTGMTMGAGQGFDGIYSFAEANGVTVVGGSSRTVGAVGGWISGGGHGALSNTLGLGVDNVLQIKAVLPNGTYITANRCQNTDLFFALRGGGGSTFGVNMEMTTTAHPKVTLQVAYIRFLSADLDSVNKFITLCVENAAKWATEGWGGYIAPGAQSILASGFILMTPVLSLEEAQASMKPLTDFAASLPNVALNNSVETSPSFYQAYETYILPNEEKVGLGLAIGSRLIPNDIFMSNSSQADLINALEKISNMVTPPTGSATPLDPLALGYGDPLQFLVTAPSSYPNNDTVPASITPAWRDATWHVVTGAAFDNNADVTTINKAFQIAHDAAGILETVAPSSGAYQNEADVFQTDPTNTFWGSANYERLSSIKQEIDPRNLLTCWDCIGWDSSDPRYGCYPAAPS